jgi:hypothetical protein
MNKRIAQKIAKAYNPASPPSPRVAAAFRRLKLPFPEATAIRGESRLVVMLDEAPGLVPDYSGMGVAALTQACKDRGLTGYSQLRKAGLVKLLRGE